MTATTMSGVQRREHTLNRLTYGPSPADRARYDLLGHTRFLDQQLGLDPVTLAPVSDWLGSMNSLGPMPDRIKIGVARMMHRAITEESQLVLVLADLFYNHLNVFAAMGVGSHTFDHYLNEDIVPNVLGSFSTMLQATAESPAMLHYLDNKRNKVGANNENYAREVMELHTLGVGPPDAPHYDEDDVKAATRILTGWSVTGEKPEYGSAFDPADHDFGPGKVVKAIDPSFDYATFTDGQAEIEQFLNDLASHPFTATRLTEKLIRRFFGDHFSDPSLVTLGSKTYGKSNTAIDVTLDALLRSRAFTDPGIFRTRIKPPHRFVAAAFRVLGLTPTEADLQGFTIELLAIGDQPYFYGPPTGYPDQSAYWLTGNGMLARFQMAETIATRADVVAEAKTLAGIDSSDSLSQVTQKLIGLVFAGGVPTVAAGEPTVPSFPDLPAWVISNDSAKTAYYYAKPATTLDERVERVLTMLYSTPEFLRY